MTNEYSNQVLHEVLIRVEEKVDKQNGRVRKLENRDAFNKGGLAILSVIILPIAFIVLSNFLN